MGPEHSNQFSVPFAKQTKDGQGFRTSDTNNNQRLASSKGEDDRPKHRRQEHLVDTVVRSGICEHVKRKCQCGQNATGAISYQFQNAASERNYMVKNAMGVLA
jgi:hypothetical protein